MALSKGRSGPRDMQVNEGLWKYWNLLGHIRINNFIVRDKYNGHWTFLLLGRFR